MAASKTDCELTPREVLATFTDASTLTAFPPILTVEQAATLAQVPKQTVYAWSSQGLLHGCSRKAGKHLRIWRDRFVLKIFNEGIHEHAE